MSENTNPKIDIKRLLEVSFQIIVDNFQYERFDKTTWKTLLSWAETVSEGHEPQEFIDTLLDLIRPYARRRCCLLALEQCRVLFSPVGQAA